MSAPPESTQKSLAASYNSPSGTKQFHHAIDNRTTDKTNYLSQLRASTKNLQDDINDFLTQKMEEDKKTGVEAAAKSKTKEDLEEENYGEEVVDDDEAGTG